MAIDKLNHRISQQMYSWLVDLFPICRSITGRGTLYSLEYIKNIIPQLNIKSIASGSKFYDWEIPHEWNIQEAWVADEFGNKVINFSDNNLHIVSYSEPVNQWVSLEELNKKIHSIPQQPDAIPYKTTYYKRDWGFCISENQRVKLKKGKYHVFIDSSLDPSGNMHYGEIKIPGKSTKEVFISTYICHPSMANNELSGPVVTVALILWLLSLKGRKYTYRIVFVPETIGSIAYISLNYEDLKRNVVAGFNITCVGDDGPYSYMPSRKGNTLVDSVATHVLRHIDPSFVNYSWLDRGSDERQYCSPGIDLPMVSIMRSKYAEYKEYHTSLDDLSFVSPKGLLGGYEAIKSAIDVVEKNSFPKSVFVGEPMMSKRGLRSSLGGAKSLPLRAKLISDVISYCDGDMSILDISEKLNLPFSQIYTVVEILNEYKLIKFIDHDD